MRAGEALGILGTAPSPGGGNWELPGKGKGWKEKGCGERMPGESRRDLHPLAFET